VDGTMVVQNKKERIGLLVWELGQKEKADVNATGSFCRKTRLHSGSRTLARDRKGGGQNRGLKKTKKRGWGKSRLGVPGSSQLTWKKRRQKKNRELKGGNRSLEV